MPLTVTQPFAGFTLGETIDDPQVVKAILEGEHSGHVVATRAVETEQPKKRKE